MIIKDTAIIGQVEVMGSHYRTNIATTFIRPALLQLSIDKQTWDLMHVFTEKAEELWHFGISLDELYHIIQAAAKFVSVSRHDLSRLLKKRVSGDYDDDEHVLRNIAANNIKSNIDIFAAHLKNLYSSVLEFDKSHAKGRKPVCLTIPDLRETGSMIESF